MTKPDEPKLTTSDERLPKTVPFIEVMLNTVFVALNVLDNLSEYLVFGQTVQLIEGSHVHEDVVFNINFRAARVEPTKKVA